MINSNRQLTSWVTKAGTECALDVGNKYNGIKKMFNDTVGKRANYRIVNYSSKTIDTFFPYKEMSKRLRELTGKQSYKYRAFELLVTLDLEIYKVMRRIIVPADLKFADLHEVLQLVFNWGNYHLYDFTIYDNRTFVKRIVPFEENLECDDKAILMNRHTLAEFLPEYKNILYTYDMGDNWEHEIQLVRVIEEYDKESPYLLEASGNTPPEDVGGVGGFLEFYKIMKNPSHPEYKETKEWVGFWAVELMDWEIIPRVIYF